MKSLSHIVWGAFCLVILIGGSFLLQYIFECGGSLIRGEDGEATVAWAVTCLGLLCSWFGLFILGVTNVR